MKNPEISIIMSAYNADKYIADSINSILKQTYTNFEFLIIDDASKDQTLKIIKKFQKIDKRIKLIKNKKNIGLTKSLNKLSKKAKGRFLARMDADDICYTNKLKKQISWFKKNPKAILLGTSGFKINENSRRLSKYRLPAISHEKIVKKLIFNNFYLHSSTMFKRISFLKIGGYRSFFLYSQDYDLWIRMAKEGRIGNLSDNLVGIRSHSDSISSNNKKEQVYYAILASCLKYKDLKIKSFIKKNFFDQLKLNKSIALHFNCLSFLYSESLPKKYRVSFFSLSIKEKMYLLKDIKFLLIKIFKKF